MIVRLKNATVLLTLSLWAWIWCRSCPSVLAQQQSPAPPQDGTMAWLLAETAVDTESAASLTSSSSSMLRKQRRVVESSTTTSSSSSLSLLSSSTDAAVETTTTAALTTSATTSTSRRRRLQLKTLKLVGDANGDGGSTRLGECEGDCDRDSDCARGLVCFQRTGRQAVPGCTGDRNSYQNRDFCVKSQVDDNDGQQDDNNTDTDGGGGGGNNNNFRIKFYWQPGYYWQEERFERKWCLQCRSRCGTGVEVALRECSSDNTRWEFVGSSQVQVKVSGRDLCMELSDRNNRDITLQPCSNSRRQLFTAGPGDFNGAKFELQTLQVAGCLSNPHHPREGELIRRQNCRGARIDTTSYYNKY